MPPEPGTLIQAENKIKLLERKLRKKCQDEQEWFKICEQEKQDLLKKNENEKQELLKKSENEKQELLKVMNNKINNMQSRIKKLNLQLMEKRATIHTYANSMSNQFTIKQMSKSIRLRKAVCQKRAILGRMMLAVAAISTKQDEIEEGCNNCKERFSQQYQSLENAYRNLENKYLNCDFQSKQYQHKVSEHETKIKKLTEELAATKKLLRNKVDGSFSSYTSVLTPESSVTSHSEDSASVSSNEHQTVLEPLFKQPEIKGGNIKKSLILPLESQLTNDPINDWVLKTLSPNSKLKNDKHENDNVQIMSDTSEDEDHCVEIHRLPGENGSETNSKVENQPLSNELNSKKLNSCEASSRDKQPSVIDNDEIQSLENMVHSNVVPGKTQNKAKVQVSLTDPTPSTKCIEDRLMMSKTPLPCDTKQHETVKTQKKADTEVSLAYTSATPKNGDGKYLCNKNIHSLPKSQILAQVASDVDNSEELNYGEDETLSLSSVNSNDVDSILKHFLVPGCISPFLDDDFNTSLFEQEIDDTDMREVTLETCASKLTTTSSLSVCNNSSENPQEMPLTEEMGKGNVKETITVTVDAEKMEEKGTLLLNSESDKTNKHLSVKKPCTLANSISSLKRNDGCKDERVQKVLKNESLAYTANISSSLLPKPELVEINKTKKSPKHYHFDSTKKDTVVFENDTSKVLDLSFNSRVLKTVSRTFDGHSPIEKTGNAGCLGVASANNLPIDLSVEKKIIKPNSPNKSQTLEKCSMIRKTIEAPDAQRKVSEKIISPNTTFMSQRLSELMAPDKQINVSTKNEVKSSFEKTTSEINNFLKSNYLTTEYDNNFPEKLENCANIDLTKELKLGNESVKEETLSNQIGESLSSTSYLRKPSIPQSPSMSAVPVPIFENKQKASRSNKFFDHPDANLNVRNTFPDETQSPSQSSASPRSPINIKQILVTSPVPEVIIQDKQKPERPNKLFDNLDENLSVRKTPYDSPSQSSISPRSPTGLMNYSLRENISRPDYNEKHTFPGRYNHSPKSRRIAHPKCGNSPQSIQKPSSKCKILKQPRQNTSSNFNESEKTEEKKLRLNYNNDSRPNRNEKLTEYAIKEHVAPSVPMNELLAVDIPQPGGHPADLLKTMEYEHEITQVSQYIQEAQTVEPLIKLSSVNSGKDNKFLDTNPSVLTSSQLDENEFPNRDNNNQNQPLSKIKLTKSILKRRSVLLTKRLKTRNPFFRQYKRKVNKAARPVVNISIPFETSLDTSCIDCKCIFKNDCTEEIYFDSIIKSIYYSPLETFRKPAICSKSTNIFRSDQSKHANLLDRLKPRDGNSNLCKTTEKNLISTDSFKSADGSSTHCKATERKLISLDSLKPADGSSTHCKATEREHISSDSHKPADGSSTHCKATEREHISLDSHKPADGSSTHCKATERNPKSLDSHKPADGSSTHCKATEREHISLDSHKPVDGNSTHCKATERNPKSLDSHKPADGSSTHCKASEREHISSDSLKPADGTSTHCKATDRKPISSDSLKPANGSSNHCKAPVRKPMSCESLKPADGSSTQYKAIGRKRISWDSLKPGDGSSVHCKAAERNPILSDSLKPPDGSSTHCKATEREPISSDSHKPADGSSTHCKATEREHISSDSHKPVDGNSTHCKATERNPKSLDSHKPADVSSTHCKASEREHISSDSLKPADGTSTHCKATDRKPISSDSLKPANGSSNHCKAPVRKPMSCESLKPADGSSTQYKAIGRKRISWDSLKPGDGSSVHCKAAERNPILSDSLKPADGSSTHCKATERNPISLDSLKPTDGSSTRCQSTERNPISSDSLKLADGSSTHCKATGRNPTSLNSLKPEKGGSSNHYKEIKRKSMSLNSLKPANGTSNHCKASVKNGLDSLKQEDGSLDQISSKATDREKSRDELEIKSNKVHITEARIKNGKIQNVKCTTNLDDDDNSSLGEVCLLMEVDEELQDALQLSSVKQTTLEKGSIKSEHVVCSWEEKCPSSDSEDGLVLDIDTDSSKDESLETFSSPNAHEIAELTDVEKQYLGISDSTLKRKGSPNLDDQMIPPYVEPSWKRRPVTWYNKVLLPTNVDFSKYEKSRVSVNKPSTLHQECHDLITTGSCTTNPESKSDVLIPNFYIEQTQSDQENLVMNLPSSSIENKTEMLFAFPSTPEQVRKTFHDFCPSGDKTTCVESVFWTAIQSFNTYHSDYLMKNDCQERKIPQAPERETEKAVEILNTFVCNELSSMAKVEEFAKKLEPFSTRVVTKGLFSLLIQLAEQKVSWVTEANVLNPGLITKRTTPRLHARVQSIIVLLTIREGRKTNLKVGDVNYLKETLSCMEISALENIPDKLNFAALTLVMKVYTALARLAGAKNQVRRFLYDILYWCKNKSYLMANIILRTWRDVLPVQPIEQYLEHPIALSIIFGLTSRNHPQAAPSRLDNLVANHLLFMKRRYNFQADTINPDKLMAMFFSCLTFPGVEEAIILLSKRLGEDWFRKKQLKPLISILQMWRRNEVDDKATVAAAINIIGCVGRTFQLGSINEDLSPVFELSREVLSSETVPDPMKEVFVLNLCRLSRVSFENVVDVISTWKPQEISSEVIDQLLLTIISKRHPSYWEKEDGASYLRA